jgi:hypothetical protein
MDHPWRWRGSRAALERVIGGNLDKDNADAVGVLDPHLALSPGLCRGLAENAGTSCIQPLPAGARRG